jgi:hypothetical protein
MGAGLESRSPPAFSPATEYFITASPTYAWLTSYRDGVKARSTQEKAKSGCRYAA